MKNRDKVANESKTIRFNHIYGEAAIALWQGVGLVIKRLLAPGSIPELANRGCVRTEDASRKFPIEAGLFGRFKKTFFLKKFKK